MSSSKPPSGSGGSLDVPSSSSAVTVSPRMAAATATWYPQNPQQGNGYLSVSPQVGVAAAAAAVAAAAAQRPSPSGYPTTGVPPLHSHTQPPFPYPQGAQPMKYPASAAYAYNAQMQGYYHHQQQLSREHYYRTRGMFGPPMQPMPGGGFGDWKGYGNGAVVPGAPAYPPHMDPNYYYQQHGMLPPPPHGLMPPHPHMNAFSPGQYPPHSRMTPGPTPMRTPMPQHMSQHDMEEHQRQWYAQQQQAQQHQHQMHAAQAAQAAQAQAHAQAQAATPQAPQPSTPQQPAPAPSQSSDASQPQQPATPSVSSTTQPPTPAPPVAAPATSSQNDTAAPSTSQSTSRAPSAGPPSQADATRLSASTPDGSSRMSAGTDTGALAPTPTDSSPAVDSQPQQSTEQAKTPPVGTSTPQTAPPPPAGPVQQGPPPAGPPYYPMRPGFGPAPGGMPPYGYPPNAGYPPQPHPAAHPSHPQHSQYMLWQQRYQSQIPPGAAGPMPTPQGPPRPGYGGYPPRLQPGPPGALSPSGQPSGKGQQTPQQQPQQAAAVAARFGQNNATPHPSSQQRPQATPSASNAVPSVVQTPQPIAPPNMVPNATPSSSVSLFSSSLPNSVSMSHQVAPIHQWPVGSVEATNTSHVKKRKLLARELINATPRRIIMALRSGLDAEAVWAINALTILLYDDTNPQPSLQQMPGLVNVIVEQLYATLSVLYPEVFSIHAPGKKFVNSGSSTSKSVQTILNSKSAAEQKTHLNKMPIVPKKGSDQKQKYTMKTRNGMKVQFRDEQIPESLTKRVNRENNDGFDCNEVVDETISCAYVEQRNRIGLGGGLAERIAIKLKNKLKLEKIAKKRSYDRKIKEEEEVDEAVAGSSRSIDVEQDLGNVEMKSIYIGSKLESIELKAEKELEWPRCAAVCPKSEVLEDLCQRALALSNVLRGFSFVQGSEHLMAKNEALLYIVGRFLRLFIKERKLVAHKRNIVVNSEEIEQQIQESLEEQKAKAMAVLDVDDSTQSVLAETANQLRDDAFVMLTHMSVALGLFELPHCIAFPIFDGLLHWAVSTVPEATDITSPVQVSPRDYSLEIMCKMVVIEKNIDMFLTTGSWARIEKLVHVLANMLTMNEETHYREFAIVILNALCVANDGVCYVCACEAPVINNLILFIDTVDQNMHQVVQTHGMNSLRDNPEMMGTSVGMLRRAAAMLKLLVKVPSAYRTFLKNQHRLLQFTMSQLMDSRVASMIAAILFEVQSVVRDNKEIDEKNEELASKKKDEVKAKEEKVENSCTSSISKPSTTSALSNGGKEKKRPIEENSIDEVSTGIYDVKKAFNKKKNEEKSFGGPASKRTCLSNGFDRNSSSVGQKNGSMSDGSDSVMTTAVA